MKLTVLCGTHAESLDVDSPMTVFSALRSANYYVDAPCGGRGLCGKCKLVIRDEHGVGYRLACQTPVGDGMEVVLEEQHRMSVSDRGDVHAWTPDRDGEGLGFAIDIGTTTLVCRLHDLGDGSLIAASSHVNPEVIYGADVISRIQACTDGHLEDLTNLIQETLTEMMLSSLESIGIDPGEVNRIVVVGNTTMLHLFTSLDPSPIGVAPYTPSTLFGCSCPIDMLERRKLNGGTVYCAPCLSGYVGADITAGLLAIDIREFLQPCLFIDLGTNGEMALGSKNSIYACATAAGPVFEGATIKHGMPAYEGAIASVGFDEGEFQLEVIGQGPAQGLCGTALIDIIALMLDHGLLDETGRILDDDEIDLSCSHGMERWLCDDDGDRALRITDSITVTQRDIRQFQLAKGAISAGVHTLLHHAGLHLDDIGSVQIAGGFAGHLDLSNAARTGLIPGDLLNRARSVGNTAIEGASALLISDQATLEIQHILDACTYIELSTDPEFNRYYPESLFFPERSEALASLPAIP